MLEPDRPQMTFRRVRFVCWITEATDTHSEYVTLIAVPLQQWLHKRAKLFHYTYIACLLHLSSWRSQCGIGQLKCDGTRAETKFRPSAKWTSPFKSAGASVQSTTGSRGVRISWIHHVPR